MNHHQILIIGGGNAGLSAAAQLLRKNRRLDVGIIEPSEKHYYQPAWTLVAAGEFDIRDTEKNEADYIPAGAKWIKDRAAEFFPEENRVLCASGTAYTYDVLVVVPGIQMDWQKIKGLPDVLGKNGVTSNYSFRHAPYTWEMIRNFEGGVVVFTNPPTAIKCGGAPHKIMYLACDYWRKKDILDKCEVHYISGGKVLFGIPEYLKTLEAAVKRYGIKPHFQQSVTEIDGEKHTLFFEEKGPDGKLEKHEMHFDFCHVVPPQSAPDFIKRSPLADPNSPMGWVDVDMHTLQHNRFPNVFSCGDVCSAPASRTGAAIRKQAPVMVEHILAQLAGTTSSASYDGYSACPIPTQYGRLMLAEFDYSNKPKMTFPFDQAVPRWTMWLLKKYVLPWLYWNRILRGTA